MTKLAFQGDICLLEISSLPAGVKLVNQPLNSSDREAFGYHPEKGLVLAQGESRAHYHAFRDTENVKMYASNDNKGLYLVVDKPATLFHEEHAPIEFHPAVYRLMFQYEYDYSEEYRRVAD